MTDTVDAVLAEVFDRCRCDPDSLGSCVNCTNSDRLATAHAAEVAERDARIAQYERANQQLHAHGTELYARAEAAERDARRWQFYVGAMIAEDGTARAAIQRQDFPAHTMEAWNRCIDKAMAAIATTGAGR